MHFFTGKKCKKKTKNHVPGIHMGLKSCWKTTVFRSKIMYFHNKNRVKKLHLHSRNRFCLNFFSQSKNRAKLMKKHNALIRLLRKNHSKSLFFFIKATHFHAKKHRNLAKKIIPAHANGQACDRTFSWWKIKKKSKLTHQKCWKTQSFNTFGGKMHWNLYFFRSKSCFLMHFQQENLENVTNSSQASM